MKVGRPKNIKTPEEMWQHFCDYREEVKGNPIRLVEQKKGSVVIKGDFTGEVKDTVELPLQRPLTFEGFQNYLDNQEIITDVTDYFENKEGRYSEFIRVCSRIKRTIRQDQIEGGMAGIYNPSITQRLNGLTEKTDVSASVKGEVSVSLNLNG